MWDHSKWCLTCFAKFYRFSPANTGFKQGQCFKLLYKRSRPEDSHQPACLKLFLFILLLPVYRALLSKREVCCKNCPWFGFQFSASLLPSFFSCMGTAKLRYVGGKGSSSTWNCFYMTRICFTFTSLMKYYPHKFFLLLESFSSVHASASYFGCTLICLGSVGSCTLICDRCGRKINFQHLRYLSP